MMKILDKLGKLITDANGHKRVYKVDGMKNRGLMGSGSNRVRMELRSDLDYRIRLLVTENRGYYRRYYDKTF